MGCRVNSPTFEFSREDIAWAVKNHGLLSMEVELSLRCNFRCPYCYVPSKDQLKNELTREEICDVISQAHELGARKIILLGGEPMLYPYLFEVIEHIRSLGMAVDMFTNGFGITTGIAEKLFAYKVNVALKMNTFIEDLQDTLTGHKGSYTVIQDALKNLRSAGYPSRDPFLAVTTIICQQNIDELRDLWCWLRNQNILPYFEVITPQGNAVDNKWLEADINDIEALFRDLQKIDADQYGIQWDVQPPLVASKCLRHRFSCVVTSTGNIMPCVGVYIPLGNIREQPLQSILEDSEVLEKLRNHPQTIKGPCSRCEKIEECYGCRGAAFNLTGDYLQSDPLCWKNQGKLDEIQYLPVPAENFLPHERPMRLVDSIISVGERCAVIGASVNQEIPFFSDEEGLDDAVYLEMIAQAVAALNGFEKHAEGKTEGYLLGAKNLEIMNNNLSAGDYLLIELQKVAKLEEFGILQGLIRKDGQLVARGEITVYEKIKVRNHL